MTTAHFSSRARTRSAAGVLRAGVHSTLHGVVFAIFCPGPAVHRRTGAMPGPGHEIVGASRFTGRIDPTPTHHALARRLTWRFAPAHDDRRSLRRLRVI